MIRLYRLPLAGCLAFFASWAVAADNDAAPTELDQVQVTATREPELVDRVPASITVVSGNEIRARGANDLRTALELVAGIDGTPGGDSGPAGSVPAMWGWREQDNYLLVVDGIPWGGAFNPATPSVDLTDVERIEILRGAAPVMFGATSFSGVIHVIHFAAGESPTTISVGGGSYGSAFGSGNTSLPAMGPFKQSLAANIERRKFSVDREDYERYHLFYRGTADLGVGRLRIDGDISLVPQTPANVIFRNGAQLRTDILPVDANHNPSDAKLDQDRYHLVVGFDSDVGVGQWSTSVAFTRTFDDIMRGFLRDYAPDTGAEAGDTEKPDDFDADGFQQKRQITDVYFDTHLTSHIGDALVWTTGIEHFYGKGKQNAVNFGYFVSLDGQDAPAGADQHPDELVRSEDERNFTGLYTQIDWHVASNFDVVAGVRLNHTRERAQGQEIANDEDQMEVGELMTDSRTKTRVAGVVGASWTAYHQDKNRVTVYADYRNTYKPVAVDFGPEAEVELGAPETSASYEVGVKGVALDGKYEYDASVFMMDVENLLTFDDLGAPIANGKARFQGAEYEGRFELAKDLKLALNYAYHDSRFKRLKVDPDTDVSNNRLELSPYNIAGAGLLYLPMQGFNAAVVGRYNGPTRLNKRNTAPHGGYSVLDASIGYNFGRVGLHVNGYNLTDRRDPVAESELAEVVSGASSYFLMPARTIMGSISLAL
ncbi:MAG TPA: TonB-dependent receptor [Nevskiaceae bacterium]|nr:TonB-dependent receptor [Nevskiaceae bacterium]